MFPKKIILNFCFELIGEGHPCFIPLLLYTFLKRYKLEQLKVIQVWMVQFWFCSMFHDTERRPSMITKLPCNFTFYTNDATYWKEEKKVPFLKLLVAWKLYVHQTKRARIDNLSCLFCHLFRAVYSIMTIFKVVTFIPHVTGEYTRCRTDSSTNSCGSFSIQQFFC